MKKSFRFFITAVFMLVMGASIFAQSHEMYLEAPTTEAVYINRVIMGDTLANGERADLERVYVLQRGGMWFYNGVINNPGWPIRIKAEDGDGPIPTIYGVVETDADVVPHNFINAEESVYLTNVAINGIFDIDPSYKKFDYGAPQELIVYNISGDYTLTADGCIFENSTQALLRTFEGIRSVKVTNCIFGNNGVSPYAGVGDGRAIDIRKTSCDTLLIVNNTFVNGNDRVVRHLSSTARINNLFFEHNTVLNFGGRYGVMAMGLIGEKVSIKDNLFIDPMTFGADTAATRQYDFGENGEPFSSEFPGKVNMAMIYSQKEDPPFGTEFEITNNYWHFTPEITSTWEQIRQFGNTTLKVPPRLTDFIASQVADIEKAFVELTDGVEFTEAPKPMADFVYWALSPPPEGAGEGSAASGSAFKDFDRKTTVYLRDTLDCGYPTSNLAYTSAQGGYPLGDLNWFPAKKTEWEDAGGISDVEKLDALPTQYSLEQNYPNPFNPSTTIRFSIPEAGNAKLSIFNLLGQEVVTVVNQELEAGSYNYTFDATNLASGVYIYQLKTKKIVTSKKMMLVK
ncbi:MAG: T9SS type A sorting domain-containing protein [Ignavibacteria bacterium]|jgi:hypothetical protein